MAHQKNISTGPSTPGEIDRGTSHLTDHLDYFDLDFRAVYKFLVALFITVVLSYLAIWGIMEFMDVQFGPDPATASPVADQEFTAPPVTVQTAPNVALEEYREQQDSVLQAKDDGGLSIDDAMRAIVAEGLPYRESIATSLDIEEPAVTLDAENAIEDADILDEESSE